MVEFVRDFDMKLTVEKPYEFIAHIQAQPMIDSKIIEAQEGDELLKKMREGVKNDGKSEWRVGTDGGLWYQGRLCESWDDCLPYAEFAYNNSFQVSIGMGPYEALYRRPCRASHCWEEIGEKSLLGPDLVRITTEKIGIIRRRLLTAQSRQKSYADTRRRDLEFEAGDHVFLKISLMKGVLRFGKKGKLAPRFIGPFQILDRKYVPDPLHIVRWEHVELKKNATYILQPTRILDRKEQVLRNKVIPLVKVLWTHHDEEEATWETKAEVRKHYPTLL
ncbi:uncharacterized protein LOC131256271 [Magnolia sinica]|uniref:uncharacterized protein LOC131256271 n=1 Tax=Magnolia sinica TaxID=86752 RepID=UPI002658954F|nr:uncharacterized protein LOC131256271 [Magnolia sinica]